MKNVFTGVFLFFFVGLFSLNLEAQNSRFTYMDLFDLQFVTNPEISPDGNTIIYEKRQFDVMTERQISNLWQISFSGENNYPVTSGTATNTDVAWSPDGTKIAYVSSEEEGKSQIFVYGLKTDRKASITHLTETPKNLQWSPDGKQILFSRFVPKEGESIQAKIPDPPAGAKWEKGAQVIDKLPYRIDGAGYLEEGYTHIFTVSEEGGAPRQLTSGDFNYQSASWTPEGDAILYTVDCSGNANLDPNNAQLYELNIRTREEKQITKARGPYKEPRVSPDGKYIAYAGFEDEFVGFQKTKLYVMNRDGNDRKEIAGNLKPNPSGITWSANSKSIFFKYVEKGHGKLGYTQLNSDYAVMAEELGEMSSGVPYSIGGSFSVADNGQFAYTEISALRPSNLAVGVFPSKAGNRLLTHLNEDFLKNKKLGQVEEFWVDSSVDDFKVQGWILTPPDFDKTKKYPLILDIHGGPYMDYGPVFSPELQFMANQGYVIVYANPRGSTSYGEDFAAYINNNYPSEDYDDLMDVVDYAIDQGYADPNNVFITGGSGGGLLSAWSIGKTNRFNAAAVKKPVINWYSFALTADMVPFFTKYWFPEEPWENPEHYYQYSPISLVGNVKTPTMVMVGQEDYRTPVSESEQFYAALKLQGVDAVMVRIHGSGHGITNKPSNLFRQVEYVINWFEKYRKD